MELHDLQKAHRTARADLASIDKQIASTGDKKAKHLDRVKSIDAELLEAEEKLAAIINKVAKVTATEADMDRQQQAIDIIQAKKRNYIDVVTAVDEEIEQLKRSRAAKGKDIESLEMKIVNKVAPEINASIVEELLEGYSVYVRQFKGSGMATGLHNYFNAIARLINEKDLRRDVVNQRADKQLAPFLK